MAALRRRVMVSSRRALAHVVCMLVRSGVACGVTRCWLADSSSFPDGAILARAAWEEAKILARRQPIEAIIADGSTEAALRAKLQLVLDARRFAIDSLGLQAGEQGVHDLLAPRS
ncbi:MAG: aminopeptidase [Gemmatimonadaceae bacterium]|nr:aminopeptidase [Gemmatimonadaceae bacterium]